MPLQPLISAPFPIPLFSSKVQAGFPSPADDYIEQYLDLNSYIVSHPAATFFVTAQEDLAEAGIYAGDLLIVDRSLDVGMGKLIIAVIENRLIVRRVVLYKNRLALQADSPLTPPIIMDEDSSDLVWGIITHIIHRAK